MTPEAGELSVGRSTLTDNLAVPASVVVNVNDTHSSSRAQAALYELVIVAEVRGIEGTTELIIDKVLPPDRQSESIQAVVSDKVFDLADAGAARVDDPRDGAGTVRTTAEIEACNVHTSKRDLAGAGRTSRWRRGGRSCCLGGRSLASSRRGSGLCSSSRRRSLGRSGCRRGNVGAGNALRVPVVLLDAAVAGDASGATGEAVATALSPGALLGGRSTGCGQGKDGSPHLEEEWKRGKSDTLCGKGTKSLRVRRGTRARICERCGHVCRILTVHPRVRVSGTGISRGRETSVTGAARVDGGISLEDEGLEV